LGHRPTGITVLGTLYIIFGIILLVTAAIFGALSSSFSNSSFLSGFGAVAGLVSGISVMAAIIEFIIAGALLSGKNWGRVLVIIFAIIDLLLNATSLLAGNVFGIIPIILDIIVLYYMWRPHVIAYFKGEEGVFYCKYCRFPATSYTNLQRHQLNCIKKPDTSSEKNDNVKNLGILKERLAKGEITKEEYEDLKRVLE